MISNDRKKSNQNYRPIILVTAAVAFLCVINFYCVTKKQAESSKSTTTESISVDKTQLIGIWGATPEENASFQILQDTIYYVDADRRLKYELSGNRFVCFDENGDTDYICSIDKLDKDSLVMENTRTNSKSAFIRLH